MSDTLVRWVTVHELDGPRFYLHVYGLDGEDRPRVLELPTEVSESLRAASAGGVTQRMMSNWHYEKWLHVEHSDVHRHLFPSAYVDEEVEP